MARKHSINKSVDHEPMKTRSPRQNAPVDSVDSFDEDASSTLETLLQKGKKQKFLTQNDIMEALPDGG